MKLILPPLRIIEKFHKKLKKTSKGIASIGGFGPIKKTKNIIAKRKVNPIVIHAAIVLIILIPVIYIINNRPKESEAAWFDDTWKYRQRVPITNAGSAQTDFEVAITLDTASLITAGKMQNDCDDIRVTNEDGKVLPIWIQEDTSNCNTSTTKVWVKFPSIGTDPINVYLYYGNSTAATVSDGNKVFMFFDDFDSNALSEAKWDQQTSGTDVTLGFSGGVATFTTTLSTSYNWISSKQSFTSPYWVESYVTSHSSGVATGAVLRMGQSSSKNLRIPGNGNYYDEYSVDDSSNTYRIVGDDAALGYAVTSVVSGNTSGVWRFSWIANGSQAFYVNDVSTLTGTHALVTQPSSSYVYIGNPTNTQVGSDSISWIFARKYASTAPVVGTLATEEETEGPIIAYKFDEGTGTTIYDSSGSGFNGTASNGPVWSSNETCLTDKCLLFDGSDDQVDTGQDLSWTTSQPFTFSVWVKPTSSTGNRVIFGKGLTGSTWEYSLRLTSLVPSFTYWNGAGGGELSLSTANAISLNEWSHIVITYDGTNTGYMYIDGNLVSTDTASTAFQNRSNNLTVGRAYYNSGVSGAFAGYIDNFKVYDYSRTAAQIYSDYIMSNSLDGASVSIGSDGDHLTSGLLGYWKLDEGTGTTTADLSGSGATGTLGTGSSAPTWTASGKFNNALTFDGTSDEVSMGNPTNLNITGSITLSAWVNLSSTTGVRTIISRWPTNKGYKLAVLSGKAYIDISSDGSDDNYLQSNQTLSTGTWYHITGVYTAGSNPTLDIYVNGIQDNGTLTGTIPSSIFSGTSSVLIGSDGTNRLAGTIDEVRVYNKAFNSSEIQSLYNYAAGPVGYWSLDDGTGTSFTDSSMNGSSGILGAGSSAPIWDPGKYGNGLDFDGVNDYAYVTDPASGILDFGTGNVSYTFWMKTSVTPASFSQLLYKRDPAGGNPGYSIAMNSSNKLFAAFDDGVAAEVNSTSTTSVNDNKWHFVAVTSNRSSTTNLYVDGKLEDSDSITGSSASISNTGDLTLGRNAVTNTQFYKGQIDDVRVYGYVLNSSQIAKAMNADHTAVGTPVGATALQLKFDEGYGTTLYDSSPSVLNGTMGAGTSAPTWTNNGKFNRALDFDGSNDYLTTANSSSLSPGSGDFTVSLWTNLDTVNGTERWFYGDYGGGGVIDLVLLRITTSNKFQAFYRDASSNSMTADSTTTPSTGTWYYITSVKRGTNVYIYVNGRREGSGSNSSIGAIDTSGGTTPGIGRNNQSNGAFVDGRIDEVKVYPFALTDDEIKTDYNGGKVTYMGSVSTTSAGVADNSTLREYCPPGETGTCTAPVGEWRFEEGTGTGTDAVKDTSISSTNHGDMEATMTAANWVPGARGNAMQFDGVNDYLLLGTSGTLASTSSITLSAWIKISQTSGDYYIVSKYRAISGKRGYALIVTNGKLQMLLGTAADNATSVTSVTDVATGGWTYVTGVHSTTDNVMRLYINGVEDTTAAYSGTRQASTTDVQIGAYGDSGGRQSYFNGKIDDVRIYGYARTAAQIAWEYNRGAPSLWYRFDECQGSTIYNAITTYNGAAAGANGTITIGGTGSQNAVGTCSTSGAWADGASGKYSSSLGFDGTDDRVAFTTGNILSATAGSVSLWVNSDGTQANPAYIFANPSTATNSRIYLSYGGTSTVDARLGTGTIIGSFTTPTGEWSHLVLTWDVTSAKFYANGKDVTTTGTFNGLTVLTSPTTIGCITSSQCFDGRIDDVKLYRYPLTPAQVLTEYNSGAVKFN